MIVAVIPMKPLSLAKRRLANLLPQPELQALVRAMLCDVLKAVHASGQVDKSFVVTADPAIAAIANKYGAGHILEDSPVGLNDAVTLAARHIEKLNSETMLVLPGDVPLVTAAEIDELVLLSRNHGLGIVAAHDGDGTNALLLAPPGAIFPSFGVGSFARHLTAAEAAGIEVVACKFIGLGRDIDTRKDLEFLATRMAGRVEYDRLWSTASFDLTSQAEPLEQQCG